MTPIDGSEMDKELAPYFIYSHGSEMAVLMRDGSIIFKGIEGVQQYIHYFSRSPDGMLTKIKYEDLGEGQVYGMNATPDGRHIAVLNSNRDTRQRFIRVFNAQTRELYNLTLPTECKNITLK